MQYVRLAKIPRPVSRLLFGCAYPGMIAGEDQTALLDQAFAAGVNAIDTAENYGKSELILGAWMAERNNRDQLTIITKGCHPYGRPRVTPEAVSYTHLADMRGEEPIGGEDDYPQFQRAG